MRNKKYTKRALVASVLSVVVCVALLVGSTFAWFTDSVTSSNNKITAGNLDISATYQDVDMKNGTVTYTVPGFDRVPNGAIKFAADAADINQDHAIISEDRWEPGAVGAKLITVKNDGNLAAKIKLDFNVYNDGLQDALWFDFVQVKDGQATGTFTQREMNTLAAFADKISLPLAPKGNEGDRVSFILLYGMKEEAGNQYQGLSFRADVTVLAAQDTYEKDSFDHQYDKDAEFAEVRRVEANTMTEFSNALAAAKDGDKIVVNTPLSAGRSFAVTGEKEVVIDLNANTWTANTASAVLKVTKGADVTIQNGTIEMPDKTRDGLWVEENSSLTLKNVEIKSNYAAICCNGANIDLNIEECTIKATGAYYPIWVSGAYAPSNITITDTTIEAEQDLAVYVSNSSGREKQNLRIDNCTLIGAGGLEMKHTNAVITNSRLVATNDAKLTRDYGGGNCTYGYALAVTSNTSKDPATGNVVLTNCTLECADNTTNQDDYFVFRGNGDLTVTINGKLVDRFGTY